MRLHESAVRLIKASAVEMYPKETAGILLGTSSSTGIFVESVYPFQTARATENGSHIDEEADERLDDFLGDWVVGEYHSHPSDTPALSEIDKEHIRDVEVVVSVWPGKRGGWRFRLAGYYTTPNGRIRLAKIVRA